MTLLKDAELKYIIQLALTAGALLKDYYTKPLEVLKKADSSPVTKADIDASDLIIKGLKSIGSIPVISEEQDSQMNLDIMQHSSIFWLIDPLDGTRSFIKKDGIFTVNIALVKDGLPIIGVLYSPLEDALYFNDHDNRAFKIQNDILEVIKPNSDFSGGYDFLLSYPSLDTKMQTFMDHYIIKTMTPITSSIKFALLAEGKGDVYPRFKNTSAWDTAAGHAILRAVGGEVFTLEKKVLLYTQIDNPNFIAVADKNIELFL